MSAALDGIRVLDLSRVLAGPYCTMVLGDLGADVIKVERPGHGDDTRGWGPPFAGQESAYFLAVNRNKRSVTLDLKTEEGRRLALRLAEGADVLVHNFRPGVAEQLGLGWETLRAHNPRLVCCTLSAFGLDGPYADRGGYDALLQAMSGLMSITGAANGPPTKVGVAIVDVLTGLFASSGILGALMDRERSGEGQHLDLSLFDAAIAALVNQAQSYLVTGASPSRMGNSHPSLVPYRPFRAADDWVMIAVGNDALFRALCEVVQRPELADDPRFSTNADRVAHREALEAILGDAFMRRPVAEWVEACLARGVPAGPIQGIDAVMQDPQAQHRGMVTEVEHPSVGSLGQVASPLHLSRTPPSIRRPPPGLGEHTDEVLAELGVDAEALARLREQGVL